MIDAKAQLVRLHFDLTARSVHHCFLLLSSQLLSLIPSQILHSLFTTTASYELRRHVIASLLPQRPSEPLKPHGQSQGQSGQAQGVQKGWGGNGANLALPGKPLGQPFPSVSNPQPTIQHRLRMRERNHIGCGALCTPSLDLGGKPT